MTNTILARLAFGCGLALAAPPASAQLGSQQILPLEPGGGFGSSLDMGEGFAAVGAPSSTVDGIGLAGRVDIYARASSEVISSKPGKKGVAVVADSGLVAGFQSEGTVSDWALVATLFAPLEDRDVFDQFGTSVSLDNERLAIGAVRDEGEGPVDTGAVYVYRRTAPDQWVFEQKLLAPDGVPGDQFGGAVSLRARELLVGAPEHDGIASGAGAAYVYRRTPGEGWNFEGKLEPAGLESGDALGSAVSVSGGRALAGAPERNVAPVADVGVVYAWSYDSESEQWLPEDALDSPHPGVSGRFGSAVACDTDAAIVGAPFGNGGVASSGIAYSFVRDEGAWAHEDDLLSPASSVGARFGTSVALDGPFVAIGANRESTLFEDQTGMVHVFRRHAAGWAERGRLSSCLWTEGIEVGVEVAIEGKFVLASAPLDVPSESLHSFRISPQGLDFSPCTIASNNGGNVEFAIHAGPDDAGKLYALWGTITGTFPGFDYQFASVPLNIDPYFLFTLAGTSEAMEGFAGNLNEVGSAFASIEFPGGVGLNANTELFHSFVVIDPVTTFVLEASDPVRTPIR